MQPGQPVSAAIVKKFGPAVLREDGTLDRSALARLAFTDGRVDELNKIVHPATISRQEEMVAEIYDTDPKAVVIVESALIFETKHSKGWRQRFDKIILVRASEEAKISRFIERSGRGDVVALKAEAKRRLAQMIPDDQKTVMSDFVVLNDGTLERLREQVKRIWGKISPA